MTLVIKKKVYPLYILLLFLFYPIIGKGQSSIKGIVKDTVKNPIPYANVLLTSRETKEIISYSYTDEKGFYKMQTDSVGEFILSTSALSFKTTNIDISISSYDEEIIKNIQLKSDAFILDEVIINSEAPITVKKDTIVFKVSSFTNGTEEVVEDILKKLPGVQVGEDGEIKVQGKTIEKVMVEGDDLFEKGYKLLTKNLNSEVINKVEVLENFSDNPLLKGIEDSDKIALNLTLKDDRKTSLFGNASLGYGTNQFYENRLNLISFNKKTKFYLFGNLNNTGVDPTGDIYHLINPNTGRALYYIGDGISAKEFINIGTFGPRLKQNRINFNNAEFASLNGIYNPTKKIKAKGLLFFNSDENDFFKNQTSRFLIGEDSFINNENKRILKKSIIGFGKADVNYNISKNSRLEYAGKYNITNNNNTAQLLFNDEEINELLENDTKFTDHRITYTKRNKDKNALLITGRYLYDERPQNYNVDNFIYEQLFPDQDDIVSVRQNVMNRLSFFGLEGNYIANNKKNNLDIKLGYSRTYNKLRSSLFFIDSNNSFSLAGNDFSNILNYQFDNIYGKLKYKRQIGVVDIVTSLEIYQVLTLIDNDDIVSSDAQLYTIPTLGLNWSINKKNKLSLLYKHNTQNFTLSDIYDGFILTSFRNFSKGVGVFGQLDGDFFLANYTYGNWSDEFLMNASFLYQNDDDYRSSKTEIRPNFSLSESFILNDKQFYSMSLNLDRYINAFSSNIKLNTSISETNFQNIVNQSDLRNIETLSYTYGAEMRSAFSGFFNFHVGTNWIVSEVKTDIKNSNIDNNAFLDLTFDISGKFSFEFSNERYYFGNLEENNRTFYFTDFNAQYTLKKNALKLKFTAQNIWNTNTFANFYIGDTSELRTEYRLLPRYFMLKIDFRF